MAKIFPSVSLPREVWEPLGYGDQFNVFQYLTFISSLQRGVKVYSQTGWGPWLDFPLWIRLLFQKFLHTVIQNKSTVCLTVDLTMSGVSSESGVKPMLSSNGQGMTSIIIIWDRP